MNPHEDVLTQPVFSVEEAEAIASQHFQIEGHARPLPGERDQNFLITGRQSKYVLKIANPVVEQTLIELENAAIGIVAASSAIESPDLVRSVSGATLVSVKDRDGQVCSRPLFNTCAGYPAGRI